MTVIDLALCDGSVFSYEPEYEDTCCDECGHVTGQRIVNEPSFHGKIEKRGNKHFCARCEQQMSDLFSITAITIDRYKPTMRRLIEEQSAFYKYYKGSQHD